MAIVSAHEEEKRLQGYRHEPSVQQFFQTTNYNIFVMLAGNRELNEKKIKKLILAIKNGKNMLPFFPILVNSNMEVLDGQHRLFAAKKCGYPIHYTISSVSLDIVDIADANTRIERWKDRDFLNCYVRRRLPAYVTLNDFIKKHKLRQNIAMQLLYRGCMQITGGGSRLLKSDFESGVYEVKKEKEVTELMDIIEKEFSEYPWNKGKFFINGVIQVLSLKNHAGIQQLKNYLSDNPEMTERLSGTNATFYFKTIIANLPEI